MAGGENGGGLSRRVFEIIGGLASAFTVLGFFLGKVPEEVAYPIVLTEAESAAFRSLEFVVSQVQKLDAE